MIDHAPSPRSAALLRRASLAVSLGLSLAFSLGTTGCKGGAEKLLGSSLCRSGETYNEDPPLCLPVPEGMEHKGEPIRRPGHFQVAYQRADGGKISFLARDLATFDATWKSLQANAARAKAPDAKEEELEGGKSRQLTYTTPEKEPRFILSVVHQGPTNALDCEAEAPKGKPVDDLIAACKAFHQP